MLRRLASQVRNQWMGAVSLFLVLAGGTAYAANTIGSADIIDNSVASVDLKNNDVRGGDVLDGTLDSVDVRNDSLNRTDVNESSLRLTTAGVVDESLTGHDVQDETIGGADVNESLLGPMTSAQIANESLTGHDIEDNTIGGADVNESLLDGVPYSPAFASHNPADFDLPSDSSYAQVIYTGDGNHGDPLVHVEVPGVVMASANLTFFVRYGEIHPRVACELGLVKPGGPRSSIGLPAFVGMDPGDLTTITLSGARRVTEPGDYYVNVVCKDDWHFATNELRATFWQGNLIAWTT